MRICSVDEIKDDIINFFKAKSILPLLGSGFSCDSKASNGIVPSGKTYRQFMLDRIKECCAVREETFKRLQSAPFSQVCDFFEGNDKVSEDVKRCYYKNNFQNVKLSELRKNVLKIKWPYIYTLNFDDAIEKTVILIVSYILIENFINLCLKKLSV